MLCGINIPTPMDKNLGKKPAVDRAWVNSWNEERAAYKCEDAIRVVVSN